MAMNLPNFLIVGFPKCGSTSFHYYLNEHPEVFLPRQKELHYFTSHILAKQRNGKGDAEVKKLQAKEASQYHKFFKEAAGFNMVGEASPSYINYPEVIPRIKESLGDVKIIILLRDPVKRAYSNYLHLVRENREDQPFFEALQLEEERKSKLFSDFWYYLFNSTYLDKVRAYAEAFSEVKVVTFERFVKDPEAGMKEIYQFLGVDPSFRVPNLDTTYNPGGSYKKNPITNFVFGQSKLKTFLRRVLPMNAGMKKLRLGLIENYKTDNPPIDPRAEAFIVDSLREDVQSLKEEFGVETQLWNPGFMVKKELA